MISNETESECLEIIGELQAFSVVVFCRSTFEPFVDYRHSVRTHHTIGPDFSAIFVVVLLNLLTGQVLNIDLVCHNALVYNVMYMCLLVMYNICHFIRY